MLKQSIAIGVIFNQHNQLLISRRTSKQHLAGCWEFPGGKLESGESFKFALRRELHEEVGVTVHTAVKIFSSTHQYSDRQLSFQLYKIIHYSGAVIAKQNQQLRWVDADQLSSIDFPEANRSMVDALILPQQYMIADEQVFSCSLIETVKKQLEAGVRIIQHRANGVAKKEYIQHWQTLNNLCNQYKAKLIANSPIDWHADLQPNYIHLNSIGLKEINNNTNSLKAELFSASCHNDDEIKIANQLRPRCILLGPVNYTQSHSNANILGWKKFAHVCSNSNMPVYALGGLTKQDTKNALMSGAQGIAAIRAFKY